MKTNMSLDKLDIIKEGVAKKRQEMEKSKEVQSDISKETLSSIKDLEKFLNNDTYLNPELKKELEMEIKRLNILYNDCIGDDELLKQIKNRSDKSRKYFTDLSAEIRKETVQNGTQTQEKSHEKETKVIPVLKSSEEKIKDVIEKKKDEINNLKLTLKELSDDFADINFFIDDDNKENIEKSWSKAKAQMETLLAGLTESEIKALFQARSNPEINIKIEGRYNNIFEEYTNLTLGLVDYAEDAITVFEDKSLSEQILIDRINLIPNNESTAKEVFKIIGKFHQNLDTNQLISEEKLAYYKYLVRKLSLTALSKLWQIEDNDVAAKSLLNFAKNISNIDSFQGVGLMAFDDRFIDMEVAQMALKMAMERNQKSREHRGENDKRPMVDRIASKRGYDDELVNNLDSTMREMHLEKFRELTSIEEMAPLFEAFKIDEQNEKWGVDDFTMWMIVRINNAVTEFKKEKAKNEEEYTKQDIQIIIANATQRAKIEAMEHLDLTWVWWVFALEGKDLVKDWVIDNFEADIFDTYNELMGNGWFNWQEDEIVNRGKIAGWIAGAVVSMYIAGPIIAGGWIAAFTALGAQAVALTAANVIISGEWYEDENQAAKRISGDLAVNAVTFGAAWGMAKAWVGWAKAALSLLGIWIWSEAINQTYMYERGELMDNFTSQGRIQTGFALAMYWITRWAVRMKARWATLPNPKSPTSAWILLREWMKRAKAVDSPVYKGESLSYKSGVLRNSERKNLIKFDSKNVRKEWPFGEEVNVEYITKNLKASDAVYKLNSITDEVTIFTKDGHIVWKVDVNWKIHTSKDAIKEIKGTIKAYEQLGKLTTEKGFKEAKISKEGDDFVILTENKNGDKAVLKWINTKDYPIALYNETNHQYRLIHKNGNDTITLDHSGNVIEWIVSKTKDWIKFVWGKGKDSANFVWEKGKNAYTNLKERLKREELLQWEVIPNNNGTLTLEVYGGRNIKINNLENNQLDFIIHDGKLFYNRRTKNIEYYNKDSNELAYIIRKSDKGSNNFFVEKYEPNPRVHKIDTPVKNERVVKETTPESKKPIPKSEKISKESMKLKNLLKKDYIKQWKYKVDFNAEVYEKINGKELKRDLITFKTTEGEIFEIGLSIKNMDIPQNSKTVFNKNTKELQIYDAKGRLTHRFAKWESGKYNAIDANDIYVKEKVLKTNPDLEYTGVKEVEGVDRHIIYDKTKGKSYAYDNDAKLIWEVLEDWIIKRSTIAKSKDVLSRGTSWMNIEWLDPAVKKMGDGIIQFSEKLSKIDARTAEDYLNKKGADWVTKKLFWKIIHHLEKAVLQAPRWINNTTLKPLIMWKNSWSNRASYDNKIVEVWLWATKATAKTWLEMVKGVTWIDKWGKWFLKQTTFLSLATIIWEVYDFNKDWENVTFVDKLNSMDLTDMSIKIWTEWYTYASLWFILDIFVEGIDNDTLE